MANITVTWTISTTKPSGLAIARDGNKLTFSWKIPSCKYEEGQQLYYRIKDSKNGWSKWTKISGVGKTTTKKQISINLSNYYPNSGKPKLGKIEFGIRGKRKNEKDKTYGWSDWAYKTFDVAKPNQPALSEQLDSEYDEVCKFSWETKVSSSSTKWFSRVLYETILVKDCTEISGSKLKWKSDKPGWGTGTNSNASGNFDKQEATATLATGSYTRWYRFKAQGPQGDSEWTYVKHVYAKPNRAVITGTPEQRKNNAGGIDVGVQWKTQVNAANTVDETAVEYIITKPDASLGPTGTTWTEAAKFKETGKAVSFSTSAVPGEDQCLYVRVNTIHDRNTTNGAPKLVRKGNLKDPSFAQVEPVTINPSTHKATIKATNHSTVAGSFLVIVFRQSKKPNEDLIVGIIPNGESEATGIQCPDWGDDPEIGFGVYACVGTATAKTRDDGVGCYAVSAEMVSAETVWEGGSVPVAPGEVTASKTEAEGTVRVAWDWSWSGADAAELSWSDHEDAWESTDEPKTFIVSNLYASAWNISGLETGKRWYVRVRLIKEENYGPYSTTVVVDLSSAPIKPTLALSQQTIRKGELFTAYWLYQSTDSTDQAYAEICTATISSGTITYGSVIKHAETAQNADIVCPDSWTDGQTYLLCLRVVSASGNKSEWSDPVAVTVAEPLTATITASSLETITISADDEQELTRSVLALTEMPLSVTVTGAGDGGTTNVIIERLEDYHVDRPDGTEFNGWKEETIALAERNGEGEISISTQELIGSFDDGAAYRLIAQVRDGFGQSDEVVLEFEVHWSHQAVIPDGKELLNGNVIEITPIAPEGVAEGDACDIYRLSADKPHLVVENAEFGTTYVDPYPAIGDYGGHRIVSKTKNGDYITEDGVIAWLDMPDEFDADCAIIDFAGEQVPLKYNLEFSNSWKKDFKETRYLGGAVQGDWNKAVGRSMSMTAVSITVEDEETIEALRHLAEYPGICHVRTPDGSSFDADIQVSESRSYQSRGRKVKFTLKITRVDSEQLDGMTLAAWEEGR